MHLHAVSLVCVHPLSPLDFLPCCVLLQLTALCRSLGIATAIGAHEWRHAGSLLQCVQCLVAGLPTCSSSIGASAPWATALAGELVLAQVVPELSAMIQRLKAPHVQATSDVATDEGCCHATMSNTHMGPFPEPVPAQQPPVTTTSTTSCP